MPPITKDELRLRAERFVYKFNGETDEDGEAKTFMDALFAVFGLERRSLAKFEHPIERSSTGRKGRADLLWNGKLLIEAKSGHLDKETDWQNTLEQALDYVKGLPYENLRPEYVLLFNFKRIKLYSLAQTQSVKQIKPVLVCNIALLELPDNLHHFEFFLTVKKELQEREIKANQIAAQLIATIHDSMELKKYGTQQAAMFLSQILFCLFAEDTGIFAFRQFTRFVQQYEKQPELLGEALLQLFEVLNTPEKQRKGSSETPTLHKFPYVNGSLFDNALTQPPPTGPGVWQSLHDACLYNWSAISPEIFGSLFQAVMNPEERRSLGAHYTSETNILRLLEPLLFDELKAELEAAKNDKRKIALFRQKINKMSFLDPACGCGNFLVVAYRELRLIDMRLIEQLQGTQSVIDTALLSNIPLHNFYGYEIDPTAARIATVAMWLVEHQMNVKLSAQFGKNIPSIPLNDAAQIFTTNALKTDWQKNIDYIIGNPPFVGKQFQSTEQKADMEHVWGSTSGAGVLDYVTCWPLTAARYMQSHPQTRTAFVSTNSIAQGEQTGILWGELFGKYGIKIHFAHQTFKWSNEAKGVAAVHCVIVGFGRNDISQKYLYEYPDIKDEPIKTTARNISPYLVEASSSIISTRKTPLCNVPEISFGSMPNDGGFLLLTDEEKQDLLDSEPNALKWIKPLISAHEFLNGKTRWCLWLKDILPNELRNLRHIYKRVEAVKKHRAASNRSATNKLAATPHLFGEIRQPDTDYIVIPSTSSENRDYIPLAFFDQNYIANNSCHTIPNATRYLFGQLTSRMHMTWVKYVCGRLESRYRYSSTVVYNNYPFPKEVSEAKRQAVEIAAEGLLAVRESYLDGSTTLADLYDPLTMPTTLLKAHEALDKAVDRCYRDAPFTSEARRIEFLFSLYEQYTSGLFAGAPKAKKGKRS